MTTTPRRAIPVLHTYSAVVSVPHHGQKRYDVTAYSYRGAAEKMRTEASRETGLTCGIEVHDMCLVLGVHSDGEIAS